MIVGALSGRASVLHCWRPRTLQETEARRAARCPSHSRSAIPSTSLTRKKKKPCHHILAQDRHTNEVRQPRLHAWFRHRPRLHGAPPASMTVALIGPLAALLVNHCAPHRTAPAPHRTAPPAYTIVCVCTYRDTRTTSTITRPAHPYHVRASATPCRNKLYPGSRSLLSSPQGKSVM
ncbi:hypothetical protein LY76DRAFT_286741 [Colletotrichum caudatum]|nr:hypothetical protein LY76DRAFT_286741 [Colletotrichum caudatum]